MASPPTSASPNQQHMLTENVGAPASALALNKATTQVAVAGRSVFKIYNITDTGFEAVSNLRVKNTTLASCNDVAWSQVDDNILASATPSGAVVIWNLNKPGFSKIENVYQDTNKRTVNRIHFHQSEPNLLISGSLDTIKVFDLRQNEPVLIYSGLSEPVRDLQFSPHKEKLFLAVQDNGYVQLYDIRKRDKFDQCFPGHNGPIFACDWHPELPDTVATAGRDMSIKVWNIPSQSPSIQHHIPTMESVSKIRWCYENRNYIASCSLKRDHSVNIWDIHRPYIAYGRFTEPSEITVGMDWRRQSASLVSVTSNGSLYQLALSEAYKPLEHANPVGMAMNPDGDIALALGNGLLPVGSGSYASKDTSAATVGSMATGAGPFGHHHGSSSASSTGVVATTAAASSSSAAPSVAPVATAATGALGSTSAQSTSWQTASQEQSSLPSKFPYQSAQSRARYSATRRSQDSALRPRISSRSQLDVYKCTEMNWFVKTAQEYQLCNRPLAELCDHNAEVCAKLRRFQVCQTWKILKLFYANMSSSGQTGATSSGHLLPATSSLMASGSNKMLTGSDTLSQNTQTLGLNEQSLVPLPQPLLVSRGSAVGATGEAQTVRANVGPNQGSHLISAMGDEYILDAVSYSSSEQSNGETDEWSSHETIPYEAFQPKHDICGRVDKLIGPDQRQLDESASSSGSSHNDGQHQHNQHQNQHQQQLQHHQHHQHGRHNQKIHLYNNQDNNERDDYNTIRTMSHRDSTKTLNAQTEELNDLKISNFVNPKSHHIRFYEIIADVIADVLKYHVDNSDVQSAVSILIVLGDRIKSIVNDRIPEMDRESWYYSYIDLLSKFQLWNVMAQVINLSPLSNINSINQTSTTIYTACGSCNRPLNGKVGWICDRCKTKPSQCSVCHGVVTGLMSWCQGCYHGGHLIHMSQWYSENDYCPTGCGHKCELSQWR